MNTNTIFENSIISYDSVYPLLKNFHADSELENSEFRNLALVQVCRRNNPMYSTSQAIRFVFTAVLETLKHGTEKQELYAFILKGRFWDEYSIARMITSDRLNQMPQRTFSNEQKKAINAFCQVLTTQEQQCRKDHPELPGTSDKPDNSDNSSAILRNQNIRQDAPSNKNLEKKIRILLAAIGILVLLVMVLWLKSIKLSNSMAMYSTSTVESQNQASTTPEATALPVFCQEKEISPVVVTDPQFMRSQGLITFDKDTNPGIINNKIRSLYAVQNGLWIGYFATDENSASGVSFYDREHKRLLNCSQVGITDGQNVNDIVVDHSDIVWIGMEKGGIARFDGKSWRVYSEEDGLPSNWIYGLYVDEENYIWAATFKGVAKFDGNRWNTLYTVENGSLVNDRVHVVTMDKEKNIWIGYIEDGVSVYHPSSKSWDHFSANEGGLSGNKIRNIVFQREADTGDEIVWIASFDNGISQYKNGVWTAFTEKDGIPSDKVLDVAVDKHNRVWVATENGVAYRQDDVWRTYDTLETINLVFGNDCAGKTGYCVDDENVFTGTSLLGFTHSKIPLPDAGLDVLSVCFVSEDKSEVCPDLVKDPANNTVIANYPELLKPGNKFFMKVTVSPFKPYQLLDSRGDQLINIDADATRLYGTFPRIPVSGSVESGQDYTFFDTNNPYVVPELEDSPSNTFTSTWRMWMQTRLIGPIIRISFTVKSGS